MTNENKFCKIGCRPVLGVQTTDKWTRGARAKAKCYPSADAQAQQEQSHGNIIVVGGGWCDKKNCEQYVKRVPPITLSARLKDAVESKPNLFGTYPNPPRRT